MDLMSLLKEAGFRGSGLKMAYAIAMAESGGNAEAHNGNSGTGDNSYGLFQINMLGGMGPERRKRYGLSSNNDLFDPLTNAKIAFKMSNGGTSWGPWSTYTNRAYMKYYGDNGASVKNSSYKSSGGGGGSTSTSKTRNETAEEYGFVATLFDAVPELKRKFNEAVKAGWSASKFQAELRDTKWWKTHSESARQYLTLQYGDPATAKQKLNQAITKVHQMANALGIVMTDAMDKKARTWALNSILNDWSEGDLRNEIGKYITFGKDGDTLQGEAGELVDKLHSYAYAMGVKPTSKFFLDAAKLVTRGMATEQDYEDKMRKMAKTLYSQWGKQIDAGQTVADIASPYFSSMSQILELPPGGINLFDPTIKKALQGKDPKTGLSSITPIWEFENGLRNDVRWKGTQNAQNSIMQVAHQVLADFGLKN